GAGAEEKTERVHAGHVFFIAADGNGRHGGARADLPNDQCRNTIALFVGLSALGLRFTVDNLRSAVPDRAGEAEYPWRQRDQGVQSKATGAKTGASRIKSRYEGGYGAHIYSRRFRGTAACRERVRAGSGR